MSAHNTPGPRAEFCLYRTSASVLRRYLCGERMSDRLVRLVAANVIGAGCAALAKATGTPL